MYWTYTVYLQMPKTFFIAIKKFLGTATFPRGIISKKSSYRRFD